MASPAACGRTSSCICGRLSRRRWARRQSRCMKPLINGTSAAKRKANAAWGTAKKLAKKGAKANRVAKMIKPRATRTVCAVATNSALSPSSACTMRRSEPTSVNVSTSCKINVIVVAMPKSPLERVCPMMALRRNDKPCETAKPDNSKAPCRATLRFDVSISRVSLIARTPVWLWTLSSHWRLASAGQSLRVARL